MIRFFLKKDLSQNSRTPNAKERSAIAQKCSVYGILLNVLLFIFKFFAGYFSGSISITSDAFNNLTDAGSSFITFIGARLSQQNPDEEHPFGHGRIEYLSSLAVAIIILLMGVELGKESVTKILSPAPFNNTFFGVTVIVLIVSVLTKIYMWYYNRKYGKIIHSPSMSATALDSLSDCISTITVLISTVLAKLFQFYFLDGICGAVVSLLIIIVGFKAAKEMLIPILGKAPDPELIAEIRELVMKHENILGIHDIVVHDYGPGRMMATLHAEVPCDYGDIFTLHDLIDNIELEIKQTTGCDAVIHMDPIDTGNEETLRLKDQVAAIIKSLNPTLSFHDFRVVYGPTHTNLIFDVVKPFRIKETDNEVRRAITKEIKKLNEKYCCVIQVDHDYTQTHIS